MATIRLPSFDIATRSGSGDIRVRRIAAINRAAAVHQAERQGLRVLACDERGSRTGLVRDAKSTRGGRIDVAQFAQELASLLDAGLGIVDAIETLAEKEKASDASRALERVVQALKEGQALSRAMRDFPQAFPPLLVASIASSEETGDMAATLRRYAANFETLRGIRSRAINASVYPLLLLGVGTLVVLFLLGVVVPRFAHLIEASHGDIPFASRALIEIGNAVNAHPQTAIGLVAGLAIAAGYGLQRAAAAGWNLAFIHRLPVIGRLMRIFRHVQFYRSCAMLIAGGIPAVRAFEMCGSLLTPQDHLNLDYAVQAIRDGSPIGPAMQEAGLADAVALRMLAVAQRTGQLADILARIASFQEASLTRAIDVATRLFEPVLMLLIGLVIGAIVVLMYLPIFDLASSIQ